jgi:hypothetical protein
VTTITIEIEADEYADSPREWRSACALFLGGNRGINETEVLFSDHDTTDSFEAAVLETLPAGAYALPVYHYTHGNVALSTSPIPNPHLGFDSGRAGVAFAFPGTEIEEVEAELSEYAQYLNGEVYQVSVEGAGIDEACGGFYSGDAIREFVSEALAGVVL